MPTLLLNDSTTDSRDLFRYKLVVVSYRFIAAFSQKQLAIFFATKDFKIRPVKCDEVIKDPFAKPSAAQQKLESRRLNMDHMPRKPRSALFIILRWKGLLTVQT